MEISTNAGTGILKEEGDIPRFNTVLFSKDTVNNLFALDELCKRYHAIFDSEKTNVCLMLGWIKTES